jgi:hypothetical protein
VGRPSAVLEVSFQLLGTSHQYIQMCHLISVIACDDFIPSKYSGALALQAAEHTDVRVVGAQGYGRYRSKLQMRHNLQFLSRSDKCLVCTVQKRQSHVTPDGQSVRLGAEPQILVNVSYGFVGPCSGG